MSTDRQTPAEETELTAELLLPFTIPFLFKGRVCCSATGMTIRRLGSLLLMQTRVISNQSVRLRQTVLLLRPLLKWPLQRLESFLLR